jgi:hypothetical protein
MGLFVVILITVKHALVHCNLSCDRTCESFLIREVSSRQSNCSSRSSSQMNFVRSRTLVRSNYCVPVTSLQSRQRVRSRTFVRSNYCVRATSSQSRQRVCEHRRERIMPTRYSLRSGKDIVFQVALRQKPDRTSTIGLVIVHALSCSEHATAGVRLARLTGTRWH